MVKFKQRNNVIPIEFGELKFEFVANDDSIKRLLETGERVKKDFSKMENVSDLEVFNTMQDVIETAWDAVLGAGTYKQVYDFAGRSTLMTVVYFLELVEGINSEYAEQIDSNALARYLKQDD